MFERGIVSGVEYFHSGLWTERGIAHGFLGAGVDSRNDSARCDEIANQISCISGHPVRRLKQVHSDRIAGSDSPDSCEADGWFASGSNSPAIYGIETADCAPVLLASRDQKFVSALHCGWRGAVAGLLNRGISEFQGQGVKPDEIEIAIGPRAGACCYEFGADLITAELHGEDKSAVIERDGKFYLDLGALLRQRALSEGVPSANIEVFEGCTICDFRFFSFRRQKALSGRQLSFISSHPVKFFHK